MVDTLKYTYKKVSSNPPIWEQNIVDDAYKSKQFPTGRLFAEAKTLEEIYESHASNKMVILQTDKNTFLPQYLVEIQVKPLTKQAMQAMIDEIEAEIPEDPEPSVEERLRSLEKTVGDMKEKLDKIYISLVDGK